MKILLAAFFMLIAVSLAAQIKIGDITVDSVTGRKYLIDCYEHPDTVTLRDEYDYINRCNGCSYQISSLDRFKQMALDYNQWVYKINIGQVGGRYLIPRKPSEIDYIRWLYKYKQ